MTRFFRTASLALALAGITGISTAHAERLTISTWGSPNHYQVSQFVPKFEELLKEKSEGEIRTRSFAGGEMVKQQFVATAIPQGTIDVSLTTMDNWSGHIPEVSILTSPLWTKSIQWTRDNLKPGNPVFDYFNEELQAQGAVLLAMFDIGPPVISATFPINGPSDFQGKSVRVYSKGAGEVIQALGAAPTIMGVGDVYSGLQRGTVDAAMGGLGGAVGLKHYEVTDFLLDHNGVLGTLIHAYVMNKEKFESLSPEMQKTVMESAQEARDSMQQFAIDEESRLIDVIKNHGNEVVAVEPGSEAWETWENALEPFTQKSREQYPAELVQMIESE
ncbi:TRAP transporter substrate-binding protein [Modicisalibacter xianhensis]|uniref:TRAP-type C4-dicarboxylate transport system, substrate-binding protein n=1 Tax=Modicisalibacter xianhensis TaxID=442341 RepID=A0A1I3GLQ4_9GAMM|nr:TRAP transporter substrate-binding protein DctP [Halomonas xianhensis]SFI24393.1 TRAP-type C4-dicarboxylate transport system, substrate-binding protein [Halomonas xianhensis]